MQLKDLRRVALTACAVAAAVGAAPAAPSYQLVEKTINRIRGDWAKPGAAAQPNAAGWNALFDATLADLRGYAAANDQNERLVRMGRLYQISQALGAVPWGPAAEVRESLREWLRPRVRIAWAERRLVDHVKALPAVGNPAVDGNRQRWVQFVNNDLGQALKNYDGATTVAQANGLKAVYAALNALQTGNRTAPWSPSLELQSAMNDLFNQPNFDVSVDQPTLYPVLAQNLVTTGPIFRKGYWSQVTAGPWMGFGLLPSDDGIAFFNRQALSSVTPVTDFQQQVQRDPKGKRAAKMYQFNATTMDSSVLTVTVVLRTSGLSIYPQSSHSTDADINTTPQSRGGFARAIASLVGYNQPRITQMAYDNAIGQIQSNVVQEANEESQNRTAQEAAQRNAQMSRYLIGGNRVVFQNILVEGLSLRSRPENALIGGKLEHLNSPLQLGADAPQPPELFRPDAGVSADLHLSSIANNFARGYLESPAAQQVQNLMVVTQDVPPGTPPGQGVRVTQNVDYPTYLREVETARAANNPKVQALRVKRPTSPPDFGVDAKGDLVALVNDFQIDVPVPPQAARGGALPPSRVLRIVSPQAEFSVGFRVEPTPGGGPLRLTGRIEGFDPGPNARVLAINEDESQATPLNAFTAVFVLGALRTRIQGQPINVPLNNAQFRGFAVQSVSPLDPSGWVRVNLVRVAAAPTHAAPVVPPAAGSPVQGTPVAVAR